MKCNRAFSLLLLVSSCLGGLNSLAHASALDEFKVKREAVFEFASPPAVTREGDRVEVNFETKGNCDVTVAIEDGEGRIVRHLASGVLGNNAPAPFEKNSRKQRIVWDGKDDGGQYLDDKNSLKVRVSLGLKPQFERSLYWTPHRRLNDAVAIMRAAPEGVYVSESWGVDQIRLFDHDGNYVRTVYPFPKAKLQEVQGLNWVDYPQGDKLPFKLSGNLQTLLTGGDNTGESGMSGRAATAMAVQGSRLALANWKVTRLATDGSSGGLPLDGPDVHQSMTTWGTNADRKPRDIGPTSAAFSPDGKTLYLTGYAFRGSSWTWDVLHGVTKVPFEGDGKMDVFCGDMKQDMTNKGTGSGPGQFKAATSVAVDKAGRVYVGDYANDRVQVFGADGKFLKEIKTVRPAQVEIDGKSQELYVFSWQVCARPQLGDKHKYKPMLFRYGTFDDPKELAKWELPLPEWNGGNYQEWWAMAPLIYRGAVDTYGKELTVWVCGGQVTPRGNPDWTDYHIQLLRAKGNKLEPVLKFGDLDAAEQGRKKPPIWNIQHQRIYVNPKTGKLYLGEPDSGPANKAFGEIVEIDPESGKVKAVKLPFNPEDICFDINGLIYMRSTDVVARYDFRTWREVPWDYGEEFDQVGCFMGGQAAPVVSGLVLPSQSPVCFHQGGMSVSPSGRLAVSCANKKVDTFKFKVEGMLYRAKPYAPQIYPGRGDWGEVHVWDKHGQLVSQDAIPGLPQIDGLQIDKDGDLYVMATATRSIDGQKYVNKMSETLMKVRPNKSKMLTAGKTAVPLGEGAAPKRPPDFTSRMSWAENAEWFYGGVGYAGFNIGTHCACWNARFDLDLFGRSFAPEVDRYQVAVLDTNGNLILRVGQYGNVDDGKPLVADGGPKDARSIGGDETSLFHAAFVATHSDKRLFVNDLGNGRMVSVKLGYHTDSVTALKDVNDKGE